MADENPPGFIMGDPPPPPRERGDLDDAKKVGRKALWERLETKRQAADIVAILSTDYGRRFYWRLLEKCGVFKSSFAEREGKMAFYEGQRNIGLFLMSEMTTLNPGAYLQMIQESKFEEEKRQ